MPITDPDMPSAEVWYRIDLSIDEYEGGEADVIESAFARFTSFITRLPVWRCSVDAGRRSQGIVFTSRRVLCRTPGAWFWPTPPCRRLARPGNA